MLIYRFFILIAKITDTFIMSHNSSIPYHETDPHSYKLMEQNLAKLLQSVDYKSCGSQTVEEEHELLGQLHQNPVNPFNKRVFEKKLRRSSVASENMEGMSQGLIHSRSCNHSNDKLLLNEDQIRQNNQANNINSSNDLLLTINSCQDQMQKLKTNIEYVPHSHRSSIKQRLLYIHQYIADINKQNKFEGNKEQQNAIKHMESYKLLAMPAPTDNHAFNDDEHEYGNSLEDNEGQSAYQEYRDAEELRDANNQYDLQRFNAENISYNSNNFGHDQNHQIYEARHQNQKKKRVLSGSLVSLSTNHPKSIYESVLEERRVGNNNHKNREKTKRAGNKSGRKGQEQKLR